MKFYADKTTAVQFVSELILNSNGNSPSITITTLGTYGDYCVCIAIDGSSGVTVREVARIYYETVMSTWSAHTQDGSSHHE